MLYHVKLQFGFHVEAADKAQAFAKASKHLRDNPKAHIVRVDRTDVVKGKRSFLRRLITGK